MNRHLIAYALIALIVIGLAIAFRRSKRVRRRVVKQEHFDITTPGDR